MDRQMKRKMYREVARKNGVTVEEVKREMNVAIGKAYENPNLSAQGVKIDGKIPTAEEFIEYAAKKIKDES